MDKLDKKTTNKQKKNYRDLKEWLILNKGIISLLTIFGSRKELFVRIFRTSEVSDIADHGVPRT